MFAHSSGSSVGKTNTTSCEASREHGSRRPECGALVWYLFVLAFPLVFSCFFHAIDS